MHLTLLKSSARSEIMVALSAGQGKHGNDKRRVLAGFSTAQPKIMTK